MENSLIFQKRLDAVDNPLAQTRLINELRQGLRPVAEQISTINGSNDCDLLVAMARNGWRVHSALAANVQKMHDLHSATIVFLRSGNT